MCRYAQQIYKERYACFRCRKTYRRPVAGELARSRSRGPADTGIPAPCPDCGDPLRNVGRDFKAPKRRHVAQWQKVEILCRRGFAFHSCGCGGPGPRPAALRDVPAFLEAQRQRSPGESLLEDITARRSYRSTRASAWDAGRRAGTHPLDVEVARLRQHGVSAVVARSLLVKRRKSRAARQARRGAAPR